MAAAAQRAYFQFCSVIGRLLRASRYSTVQVNGEGTHGCVAKKRLPYAPVLIWLGDLLVRVLNTGVTVLSRRDWVQREREMYRLLYSMSVEVDRNGTLILPFLAGQTLAALLEDPAHKAAHRSLAIVLAANALAELHRKGLTHGDAMAENVMIDMNAGTARWFDFETLHDVTRSMPWRRADDVRALLTTCLLRTGRNDWAPTLRLIIDAYRDDDVTEPLQAYFAAPWHRALPFHLGQAPLSFASFLDVQQLINEIPGATEPSASGA